VDSANRGADKVPVDPAERKGEEKRRRSRRSRSAGQTSRILTFVVRYFKLHAFLLTEDKPRCLS
jgi:hypothetical protein